MQKLLIGMLALLSALACAFAQQAGGLVLESLSKGKSPVVRSTATTIVARDARQWAAAWSLLSTNSNGEVSQAPRQLPPVDFTKSMVLGVVLPSSPHGCTGVTVTSVQVVQGQILVEYHERQLQPGEMCTASITTAYHFVSTPMSVLPVSFVAATKELPNPSIERTSPGKPGAASHVKR